MRLARRDELQLRTRQSAAPGRAGAGEAAPVRLLMLPPAGMRQEGGCLSLKERYVHEHTRFEGLDIRGNLEVPVGGGHARDVPG